MAISSSNFVNITSKFIVGRPARDFGGIVISKGTALKESTVGSLGYDYAKNNVVTVDSTTLGDLFAETTDEYKWGSKYFSYISPSGNTAPTLKFMKVKEYSSKVPASYTAEVVVGAKITGVTVDVSKFGPKVSNAEGLYEFIAASSSKWQLKGKDITATDYGLTITGTYAEGDKFTVYFVPEIAAGDESALAAFKRAIDLDGNFGSFTFLSYSNTGKALPSDLLPAVRHNVALNAQYRMVVDVDVSTSTAQNYYEKYVKDLSGVIQGDFWDQIGLTLCANCSFLTMARFAATDFVNGTTSCDMFKEISGVNASVTDDANYRKFNRLRINFVGNVKNHGDSWNWYMRGYNMDGVDTACYDNEIWFKSSIVQALLNLQGNSEKIPANQYGLSIVSITIQDTINKALANQTILPGKPISSDKKAAIIAKLGNSTSLYEQLVKSGYVKILNLNTDGEEYRIDYMIVYLKGDSIRTINGEHYIA